MYLVEQQLLPLARACEVMRDLLDTPDGATYVRESVIRPGGDPLHPVTVLAWLEGDKRLFAEQAAQ